MNNTLTTDTETVQAIAAFESIEANLQSIMAAVQKAKQAIIDRGLGPDSGIGERVNLINSAVDELDTLTMSVLQDVSDGSIDEAYETERGYDKLASGWIG